RNEVRVVRVARGMIGREIELREVVLVALDLTALVDRVADAVEQVEQLVPHLREHVRAADPGPPPRQRDVERVLRQGRGFERRALRFLQLLEPALDQVQRPAGDLLLLERKRGDLAESARHLAALAADALRLALLELGKRRRPRDRPGIPVVQRTVAALDRDELVVKLLLAGQERAGISGGRLW